MTSRKRNQDANESDVVLKFRNYTPSQDVAQQAAQLPVSSVHELLKNTVTVEQEAKQDETILLEKKQAEEPMDIGQLMPNKVDWDLKRALEPKMTRLDRQTRVAIAELIRERVINQKSKGQDFVDAVNASAQALV
jgi:coiled-coil domain-containing protein 12